MGRKASETLVRIHLHLTPRDLERIDALFGQRIKRSEAVRLLIGAMLDQIEDAAALGHQPPPIPSLKDLTHG